MVEEEDKFYFYLFPYENKELTLSSLKFKQNINVLCILIDSKVPMIKRKWKLLYL